MVLGTLKVVVVEVRNLKREDGLFSKNDPYVVIDCNGQRYKTDVKKSAGSNAQYNQIFELGINDKAKDLKVEVLDSDAIRDDVIGSTKIPLQSVFEQGHQENWYTIGKGSKTHGEVRLILKFDEGRFPEGYDPDKSSGFDYGTAAGVTGGVLAAGAAAYAGKMAYDHYNKNKKGNSRDMPEDEQQGFMNDQGGNYSNQPQGGYSNREL